MKRVFEIEMDRDLDEAEIFGSLTGYALLLMLIFYSMIEYREK